jgi:hypothetical protein
MHLTWSVHSVAARIAAHSQRERLFRHGLKAFAYLGASCCRCWRMAISSSMATVFAIQKDGTSIDSAHAEVERYSRYFEASLTRHERSR